MAAPRGEVNEVFSEETLTLLTQAGWNEERVSDIDNDVTSLSELGFDVYLSVKQFLSQFGGLVIQYIPAHLKEPQPIRFDVSTLIKEEDQEQFNRILEKYGHTMCFIGTYDIDLLVMNVEGNVYGLSRMNNSILLWGTTGKEAIENIVTSKYFGEWFSL